MSITQAELDLHLAEIFRSVDESISLEEAQNRIGQKIGADGRVYIAAQQDTDGTRRMFVAPALGAETKLEGPTPPPSPTYVIRTEFAQHIS